MSNNTNLEALTGTYNIDPSHSSVGFVARHAMITKVRGTFNEYEGTLHLDGVNPSASTANVVIKVASVDSRNADRDGHLRSADFFDAEQFPEIRFTSTSAKQVDADHYVLAGDLTIRDITKSVEIPFELTGAATDPFGNFRVGFEGSVVVNRKDWGLTWNAALEAGGVLVSEKVTLEFELSAVRAG